MPSLREWLRRLLVAGVPGAPAISGVPADRAAELEAELEPVFALLQEAVLEARRLEENPQRETDRSRAEEQARAVVAEGGARAGAERAAAAAATLARADAERAAMLAEAAKEAERIDRAAAQRMPSLIEELVRRVLAGGSHPDERAR